MFNLNSFASAVGIVCGDASDIRVLLGSNFQYALETRLLHGRLDVYQNGANRAVSIAGQTKTKATAQSIVIATALKAGFHAMPSVIPNMATANKKNPIETAATVKALILEYREVFFKAFDAAMPVSKAEKTAAEKATATAAKTEATATAAIAYAKDNGYALVTDIDVKPFDINEFISGCDDDALHALIHSAQSLLDARKAAVKADADKLAERKAMQAIAKSARADKLLQDKRDNAEQRAMLTLQAKEKALTNNVNSLN